MLISRLASIEKFLKRNPAARSPMARWLRVAEGARWQSIVEVRSALSNADAIKGTDLTCFNIGGGNYRLTTVIAYERQEITIVELLTHAEYDKKHVR